MLKYKNIVYLFVVGIFFCEFFRVIIFFNTSKSFFPLYISASFLILIMALYLRFFEIDSNIFISIMTSSDITEKTSKISPKRFLNFMPIAMIFCTIGDLIIYSNFIFGAIIFLFAQIFYIIAYSGIIHLHPKYVFSQKNLNYNLSIILLWVIIIIILYLSLIYSPSDLLTLLVIPYIISIGAMVIITYLGYYYTKRSFGFRISLILGSTIFLLSDTILGYNYFNKSFELAGLLIILTYLLSVFLLQSAIIFINSSDVQ